MNKEQGKNTGWVGLAGAGKGWQLVFCFRRVCVRCEVAGGTSVLPRCLAPLETLLLLLVLLQGLLPSP